jgi:hypothetical protein
VDGGGRVELRAHDTVTSDKCIYDARFFVAESELSGRFLVQTNPTIQVVAESVDDGLPAWLLEFTTTLLRTTARSAAKTGFPRRLTRWRAAQPDRE